MERAELDIFEDPKGDKCGRSGEELGRGIRRWGEQWRELSLEGRLVADHVGTSSEVT